MKGTWKADDHPAGQLAVLAVVATVLLGSGAAAAAASVIMIAVIVLCSVLALAVIGLAALVVYRTGSERRLLPA